MSWTKRQRKLNKILAQRESERKQLMNTQLKNRLKSLAWRVAMFAVAGLVDVAIVSLSDFNLPNEMTAILGLVLGEVSKYLNTGRK
jgi:heme-binding NEAT domain protein|tara:strand:- start:3921 stop:4178 length:258 start_codon:yes stop_codon:yes gene_type:complete